MPAVSAKELEHKHRQRAEAIAEDDLGPLLDDGSQQRRVVPQRVGLTGACIVEGWELVEIEVLLLHEAPRQVCGRESVAGPGDLRTSYGHGGPPGYDRE